ncbi:MAG: hypothetical protein PHQ23_13005, partial [Candidatus Wallbacteria bacterium]|nr:hypothetical protein [Candidatus Wallbacteria bacterium]
MNWIPVQDAAEELGLSEFAIYKILVLTRGNFEKDLNRVNEVSCISSTALAALREQMQKELSAWDEIARSAGFCLPGRKPGPSVKDELSG